MAFKAEAHASGANVSQLELAIPPGTVAGDFLLVQIALGGNGTVAAPAGQEWLVSSAWTVKRWLQQNYAFKFAGENEPASYTFSWGSSLPAAGGICSYADIKRYASVSAPAGMLDSVEAWANAVHGNTRIPGPSGRVGMGIQMFSSSANASFSAPDGIQERYEISQGGVSCSCCDIDVSAWPSTRKIAIASVSGKTQGLHISLDAADAL
jgi:hypothetical protein